MTNVIGKFTQVITGDGYTIKIYPSIKPITMTGIEELEKDFKEAKESLQRMRDKLNELKDSEPEYEKDTWYRFKGHGGNPYFVKNKTIVGDKMKGPEFPPVGSYTKNGYGNLNQLEGKATKDEMQEVFVTEAKRRGWITEEGEYFDYMPEYDALMLRMSNGIGKRRIYQEGDWAEPINSVTINGVEIIVDSDHVKLDCGDKITKPRVTSFIDLINKYDLTVHRQGEDITHQIKKLSEQI